MTVQELYDLTNKQADPCSVEIRLRPDGREIAELEFEKEDKQVSVYLLEESAIHLCRASFFRSKPRNNASEQSICRTVFSGFELAFSFTADPILEIVVGYEVQLLRR